MRETLKYFISVIVAAVLVAMLAPFASVIGATTVALSLLLLVLLIATIFGSRQALAVSIFAVLCFNFFFLPPLYTFTIQAKENWVAFAAFIVTSLVAGQLSEYARRRAQESEHRKIEIERLYTKLQDAFEEASEAKAVKRSEKLKSALLDAVTHDLRTPLTSIKASATALMEDSVIADKESRNELLEIINEEAERLNRFVGGMVDLAKIEAGKLNLRQSWISVREVIDKAIDRAQFRLADHRLKVELERELPSVRVDADSVEEVIYTLLDNAAKYSYGGTDIRVMAWSAEDETVKIVVEDQGRGVDPEDRERIFDRFYRAVDDDIHSTGGGLGLGLAIARGIAESQGGHIWVEGGCDGFVTRFVFQIPIGDNETDELRQDSE